VLAGYLRKQGHTVVEAGSADEAMAQLRKSAVDIVFTDVRMPGKSGHDLLNQVRVAFPESTVILMTAFGTIEGAVEAMRAGAYDFLTKPIDLEALDHLVLRVSERQRLLSENRLLREQLVEKYSFDGIVSQSSAMEEVLNTAGRVAQSKASVLICGESGTGKELLARAIHYSSGGRIEPSWLSTVRP